MPFTPVESSIGGLLIGASVASHLLLIGEIAGISGIFNDVADIALSKFREKPRRLNTKALFFFGLVLGGFLLRFWVAPEAFKLFSNAMFAAHLSLFNHPLVLSVIAGAFVGFGTRFGSGCTSGHFLIGIARLSKRSIVATATFCSVCMVLVKVFGRTQVIHDLFALEPSTSFMVLPEWDRTLFLLQLLLAVLALYALLIVLGFKSKQHYASDSTIGCTISMFNGLVFALGLGLSGMTLPSKVLGFFDIGGQHFDPSLLCVAVGGILPNLLFFQTYLLPYASKTENKPLYNESFSLPKSTQVTWPLLIGSALFGVGWGLLGGCPGPVIVNLASLKVEVFLFLASFVVASRAALHIISTNKIQL